MIIAQTSIAGSAASIETSPEVNQRTFANRLDVVHERLRSEPDSAAAQQAVGDLFGLLQHQKLALSDTQWQAQVRICREHPLRELVHQDPFTWRAFSKPRGYAGDAVMMDYIYGREEGWDCPEATPLGRNIFEYTTSAPASEGVRCRRGEIAELIDRFAETRHRPDVLAVAAGHLREAALASSVRRRRLGRFVALDADAESLAEVARRYGTYGIETLHARFGQLITGRMDVGQFDLVYSLGLFDYLQQSTATRLVSTLFQLLQPGGSLVVANFMPNIRDIGYMEAFMDWQLVYRTRSDMVDLTSAIPQSELDEISVYAEENQNIIFLKVVRRKPMVTRPR